MKDWIFNLALAALAVLAPIQTVLITVGCLVFADFLTGIWAALKEGQPITSAALRRTVSKAIVYQIAVISGFILEKFLMADAIPVAKLIAGTIGLVEVKSVLENTKRITGQDIFKDLIGKLGSKNDQP